MTTARLDQRPVLHDMIDDLFSVGELRDLYNECGLDYDGESGTKSNHIWALINHYSKREKMLSQLCAKFPGKDGNEWPFQ